MVLYSMVINSPHLYAAKLLKNMLQPKENAYILTNIPTFFGQNDRFFIFYTFRQVLFLSFFHERNAFRSLSH